MMHRVAFTAGAAARRAAAPRSVRMMSSLEKSTEQWKPLVADWNAEVAKVQQPPCVIWGPRAALDIDPESYEEDLKAYWEEEWDEWMDTTRMWDSAVRETNKTVPQSVAEQLDWPMDKFFWSLSPMTEAHFDKWMAEGEKEQRILMPLCGGVCYEMAFFTGIGHQVVGVEYVRSAIDTMNLQDILPEFTPEGWRENFLIHQSRESGAIVAEGDWFKATPEELGTFDKAWDRCGITSVPKEKMADYAKVFGSLMNKGGKVLLETQTATADADGTANDTYNWGAPAEIEKHFKAAGFTYELLSSEGVDGKYPYQNMDVKGLQVHQFLLTKN